MITLRAKEDVSGGVFERYEDVNPKSQSMRVMMPASTFRLGPRKGYIARTQRFRGDDMYLGLRKREGDMEVLKVPEHRRKMSPCTEMSFCHGENAVSSFQFPPHLPPS